MRDFLFRSSSASNDKFSRQIRAYFKHLQTDYDLTITSHPEGELLEGPFGRIFFTIHPTADPRTPNTWENLGHSQNNNWEALGRFRDSFNRYNATHPQQTPPSALFITNTPFLMRDKPLHKWSTVHIVAHAKYEHLYLLIWAHVWSQCFAAISPGIRLTPSSPAIS